MNRFYKTGSQAYRYDDAWGDKLSYVVSDGTKLMTIEYDSVGNPTKYLGESLTWTRGRLLASYGSTTYKYDGGGLRYEKTVDGTTKKYLLNGSDILSERWSNGREIIYSYDSSGVSGMVVDGQTYIYVKNLSGDVTEVYDKNYNCKAKYSYDAFGICTTQLNIDGIADTNPFRYRSYYYDTETKLYYLQTRYYDPHTGRFLNADDVAYLEPEVLCGLNLYAYCLNNPVMYIDPSGQFVILAFLGALLVGGLIGGTVNAIQGENFWVGFASGMVQGGLFYFTGGAANLGVAFGIGVLSGAAGNLVHQVGTGLANGQSVGESFGNVNWLQVGISGVIGGVSGGISYGLGQFANSFAKESNAIIQGAIRDRVMAGLNPISQQMMKAFAYSGIPNFAQKLLPPALRAGMLGLARLFY